MKNVVLPLRRGASTLTRRRLICVALAAFLGGAAPQLAAGGSTTAPSRSLASFFVRSQTAVVGEVTYTAAPIVIQRPAKYLPSYIEKHQIHRFKLRVQETLYGKRLAEKVLTLNCVIQEGSTLDWKPTLGSKAVAFLDRRDGIDADGANVFHAHDIERVPSYDHAYVQTVREIGRILDRPMLVGQARAAVAGCFSRNEAAQRWCWQAVTGVYLTREEDDVKESNRIAGYLGADGAHEVMAQVLFAERHDIRTTLILDGILASDPRYRRSDRRYETLWSAIDSAQATALPHPSPERHFDESIHRQELRTLFRSVIPKAFPDRADETIARLLRIVETPHYALAVREYALLGVCDSTSNASDAMRAKAIDVFEAKLKDPELGGIAAIGLEWFAKRELQRVGQTPPRIMEIGRKWRDYPEDLQWRIKCLVPTTAEPTLGGKSP